MKTRFFIILYVIGISKLGAVDQQITLEARLSDEYQSGRITRVEYVAYSLMGLMLSEQLPQRYQHYRSQSRLGSGLLFEARALYEEASTADRHLLQEVLSRPDFTPLTRTSPSGRFMIHFTDTGSHATADTFVTQIAATYDSVFKFITENLSFNAPPIDDISSPEYDVYVYDIGDYGMTTPEQPAPSASYPNAYTSYIHMDNTFDNTYAKGVDAMQVTAAHEFLHMVQIGYRSHTTTEYDSRWLFEGTATWMEDTAYDDVNDYVQYIPHYFISLDKSFYTFNGLHEYGSCLFYHMLDQKYGLDIIRSIWENFAKNNVFDAVETALEAVGSSFALELGDHMIWNYFTELRADPERYYDEGELYPLVEADKSFEIESQLNPSVVLEPAGAFYWKITPLKFGQLSIIPNSESPHWMYAVINQQKGGEAEVFLSSASQSLLLSQMSPSNDLFLVPTQVSFPGYENETIDFSLDLGEGEGLSAGIKSIFPNPYNPQLHSRGLSIDVRLLDKTKRIQYYILDENGGLVYSNRLQLDTPRNGDFTLFWTGGNQNGERVSPGIYIVYIDAEQDIKPKSVAVVY